MKTIVSVAALLAITAMARPLPGSTPVRRAPISAELIAQLAPDLGAVPPLAPSGFGDCLGPVNGTDGTPARVPCQCPPTREAFIEALTTNVIAGKAVNNTVVKIDFPTGNSDQDKQGRITASAITLQNLEGPGKGCPLVATTLGVQSKQIAAGTAGSSTTAPPAAPPPASSATPPPASSAALPPASSTTSAASASPSPSTTSSSGAGSGSGSGSGSGNGTVTADDIARLAPDLGAAPPLPTTGFGDCFGPVAGTNGKNASVPCECPPTRERYLAALTQNVMAGRAVNNTVVAVSFPLGDNVDDKHGRITAASITLQNLEGPGKGCPLVSTTLGVQSKALDAGKR